MLSASTLEFRFIGPKRTDLAKEPNPTYSFISSNKDQPESTMKISSKLTVN